MPMTHGTRFRSLAHGFHESAARSPERPALFVDGEYLTYRDLQSAADHVTSLISQHERSSSPLGAVWAYRSTTAYAGALGVLGAGKGYVPLNPRFPIARTRSMLAQSGAHVLVVGRECLAQLPELLVDMDRPLTLLLPEASVPDHLISAHRQHHFVPTGATPAPERPPVRKEVAPDDVAYLLFTSGSTGEPKGVPISHANVRSYVDYIADRYEVSHHDRFSQAFDQTFDLSVHDMFVCWERGACLYCVPARSTMAPAAFIREHRITMWFSVPSVAGLLHKMRLLSPGCFPSLRVSLFCGEPLSATYAQLWQAAAPSSIVENLYGPTEATISISHYRWDPAHSPGECLNGIVPLGWIFPGQRFRVTDAHGRPVRAGESGELCLSGPQIGSGYWNNPLASGQRFARLPDDPDVWYRTGDVVKQDSRDCLYFLGRIDHQVKIRGHRVELQEIEAVLRDACRTEQVVSLAWPVQNGSAHGVVAFVSGLAVIDQDRVIATCRRILPDYMVPKNIYLLDAMPLTPNGKIDRRRLEHLLGG
jgi:amino acid adenylation domain-containing protein